MFVGDLDHQVAGVLAAVQVQGVSQSTGVGAQVDAQLHLGRGEVCRSRFASHAQRHQRFGSTRFGLAACLGHGGFKNAAMVAGECGGH